jgi:hypothetical protein
MDLNRVVEDYLDAVAFTEDEQLGDDCIGFHPSMWAEAKIDCRSFMNALDEHGVQYEDLDPGMFATDFWLTRNHHGAGFWDRGLGDLGDVLTAFAHLEGERDTYLGDDGYAYFV